MRADSRVERSAYYVVSITLSITLLWPRSAPASAVPLGPCGDRALSAPKFRRLVAPRGAIAARNRAPRLVPPPALQGSTDGMGERLAMLTQP